MYDPNKLQAWMLGPPSEEVLAWKHELRDAYAALLSAPEHDRWNPLNVVKSCEDMLAAQLNTDRGKATEL
jgi:hypothetical protein